MTDDLTDKARMEARLWREIEKARFGMLGLADGSQGFQPMTAFVESEDGRIWFYSKTGSDLARAVQGGGEAMLIVQARDQEFQACLRGPIEPRLDRGRIDRWWSPAVAAWYPGGKDDPELILLCFEPQGAEIWVSERGPLKFAWEISRANAERREPDLGGRARLDLSDGSRQS